MGAEAGEQPRCSLEQAIEVLAAAPVEEVQERGYHFQRRDYYSALNDPAFLRANWDLWHDRPMPAGVEWDLDAQIEEVRRLSRYFGELADVPREAPPGPPRYHWENDFWRGADAMVQYALLRDAKPRRVVEIGSGWSSLVMAEALTHNEAEGEAPTVVDQVEPFPRVELLSALPAHWTMHESILQRADLSLFEALGPGDVCFYDGSHVVRPGSDVVWFFFEVVPRLAPGVLIQVHDIFWPAEYPDDWILERGQTWNEQYLLQAFLMYNRRFEPLICNPALHALRREAWKEIYVPTPDPHRGASFWMRVTDSA